MRGGLLRQGSILTVTSYATRTSPVIRGKWILTNILGMPPPPPPPTVPPLKEQHRCRARLVRCGSGWPSIAPTRPAAGCHQLMDPVGFALENYDAVGRWRTAEDGKPIDARAGCPTAASSRASPAWSRRC